MAFDGLCESRYDITETSANTAAKNKWRQIVSQNFQGLSCLTNQGSLQALPFGSAFPIITSAAVNANAARERTNENIGTMAADLRMPIVM